MLLRMTTSRVNCQTVKPSTHFKKQVHLIQSPPFIIKLFAYFTRCIKIYLWLAKM